MLPTSHKRVVVKRAHHNEVVEIQWTLPDGSVYWERRTLPPPIVREARLKAQPPVDPEVGVVQKDT